MIARILISSQVDRQMNLKMLASLSIACSPLLAICVEGLTMVYLGTHDHTGYFTEVLIAFALALVAPNARTGAWIGLNRTSSLLQGTETFQKSRKECANCDELIENTEQYTNVATSFGYIRIHQGLSRGAPAHCYLERFTGTPERDHCFYAECNPCNPTPGSPTKPNHLCRADCSLFEPKRVQ